MRRVLIAVVVMIPLAIPALAKGVAGAVVEGPGIEGPLVIEGDGTSASAARVSRFLDATGFSQLVWGGTGGLPAVGITSTPPTHDLGPEYSLTWLLMGPEGDVEIPGLLYPLAATGPLVFLDPGFEVDSFDLRARGGWYAAPSQLLSLLEEYGVEVVTVKSDPALFAVDASRAAPAVEGAQASVIPVVVLAALVMVGAPLGLRATRRRPRRLEAS